VHSATAAEVFGVALDRVSRAAPQGQGDQLRPDLRHVGLRPGAAAAPRPRRGAALHRRVLRALPGVRDYMDRTRALPTSRATWRRSSAAACTCRRSTPATRCASRPPSARRSTRRCRARPRTSSSAPCSMSTVAASGAVDARMIMQVHDELVLEVAEDQLDSVCDDPVRAHGRAAELAVPLLVEAGGRGAGAQLGRGALRDPDCPAAFPRLQPGRR
jgi:DNA polymerase-1